jgi:hypothetical protein
MIREFLDEDCEDGVQYKDQKSDNCLIARFDLADREPAVVPSNELEV